MVEILILYSVLREDLLTETQSMPRKRRRRDSRIIIYLPVRKRREKNIRMKIREKSVGRRMA